MSNEKPGVHIGVIVPSSNRSSEPQLHAFAPEGMTFHTMRGRVAGKWSKPINELIPEIKLVASMLAETEPELIVYNCTSSSMQEGIDGEARILRAITDETGIPAVSTSKLVADAFASLGVKWTILITPYATNATIVSYLAEVGVKVVKDIALGLQPSQFPTVSAEEWIRLAQDNDCSEADSIFLSCAATTQIYSIDRIEALLGKPVINSNQAVIWGCREALGEKTADVVLPEVLGTLVGHYRTNSGVPQ